MTYNINEKSSDNFYNCPVVAYYSELLKGNADRLSEVKFLYPYLNINSKRELTKELHKYLNENLTQIIGKAFNAFPQKLIVLMIPTVICLFVGWWLHK